MVRAVDDALLADLTRLLRESANPTRIILFGSHARGNPRPDSDMDVLVIVPHVDDRMAEMVRLSRVLSPLRLPVDLLVVSTDAFEYWCHTPGNIYSAALADGKVLYEQAA
jgi:predicted nucleotidyltransferase